MNDNNFLENQVLLDLTLGIQTENDVESLISKTLRKILRLLNASSVGFLPTAHHHVIKKIVIPKKVLLEKQWVKVVGQLTHIIDTNRGKKFSQAQLKDHFFYGYKIGDFGILVFCRKQPINDFFLNEFALFTNALNRAIDRLVLEKIRYQAEQEAKESRQQLQRMLSTMQDVVWAVSMYDFKPLYTSPSFESLYGIPVIDWYSDINLWKSCVHPEDKYLIDELEGEIAAGNDSKRIYRIVVNGTIKWVDNRVHIYRNEHGIPEMMTGIVRDISSQVEAENAISAERRLLETVINNLPSKIYIKDTQRRKQLVNFAELEHLGKSLEEVIGKTDEELYNAKIATESREEDDLILSSGVSILNKEVYNERTDGKRQWLLVSKVPLRDENAHITGILGVSIDISDLKMKEEELTQKNILLAELKEKAEAANRFKSEFLANMSHEIRTPLNAVIGFTDLLLDTELEDSQRQYLNMVFTASNSLIDLINDILDFSKIEAGKVELNTERTDLPGLCYLIADMVKQKAHYKGLEFIVDIDSNVPRYIWVDPLRLRQILINLLSNAVKFTHSGEVALEVTTSQIDDGTATLEFVVRDTGIGINNDNQAKVFEAFSQEDASTTRKYGGTGLGLSISNKLLSLMDSELHLESEVGLGSSFSFPMKIQFEPSTEKKSLSFDHLSSVLVVDDNDASRTILCDYFRSNNISVEESKNGVEALDKLNKSVSFDLIILDLEMPYLDGIKVAEQIRKNPKSLIRNIPIMLLHARPDESSLDEECARLHVEMRLSKPINLHSLGEQVIMHFGSSTEAVKSTLVKKNDNSVTEYPLHVLVAEDVKANSFLLKVMLKNLLPKAQIHIAENGSEALDWVINNPRPDLIILDIQMPIKNGYEVAEIVRSLDNTRQIPILALTAGTVQGEKERCKKAGFDDYLTKPIILDTLKQALLPYVNKWELKYKEASIKDSMTLSLNAIQEELAISKQDLMELFSLSIASLSEKSIPTLTLCAKSRDMISLKKVAHEIKGIAGTFHFNEVAQMARSFQLFSEWNEPQVSQHLEKFISHLKVMNDSMTSWLTHLGKS